MKLSELEIKYFKELTELIGVSGQENDVAAYLKKEYQKLNCELIYDNLGSIFALKKSKKTDAKKVMVVGHMDEVGFMVKQILPNGLIVPTFLGGFNYNGLLSQRLVMINNKGEKIFGSIDTIPPHLMKNSTGGVSEKDILFDFGFLNSEDAINNGVEVGCPVVCKGDFQISYNKECILSKAIDDRYGLVLGLILLNEIKDIDLPFDLYVGGSVQEEVGCRGAQTSANKIKPDLAIVLDCSPARDSQGGNDLGKLGEGVLIRYFDRSMIAFKKLLNFQIECCKEAGVKYQYFDSPGGTDAGIIHKSLDGIPTLTHCICARSIHTSSSFMRIDDYLAAKKSILVMINKLNNELIESFKGK